MPEWSKWAPPSAGPAQTRTPRTPAPRTWVVCDGCHKEFPRAESWEKLCLVCWKEERGIPLSKADESFEAARDRVDDITAENARLTKKLAAAEDALKSARAAGTRRVTPAGPIPPDKLKELISLCHPDKHKGSERATEATKWLLGLRGSSK